MIGPPFHRVLMIDHGWGGGVGRHVEDLSRRLEAEGISVVRGVFQPDTLSWRLSRTSGSAPVGMETEEVVEAAHLTEALRRLEIDHVHVHSLVALPVSELSRFLNVLRQAGLAYDVTCHDYSPICPRLHMVDWGGVFCDNQSNAHCRVCIDKVGSRFGRVEIDDYRAAYDAVLSGARRVFAPDPDVAARLGRFLPQLSTIHLRLHPPLGESWGSPVRTRTEPAARRVIGLVGAIGPEKGSSVLLRLAGDALERALPLRFHLFGYTDRSEIAAFPNVHVTGRYEEAALDAMMEATAPDLLLYPAVAPETFCYALDAAFRTGRHAVAFDIGAPARRIREAGLGTVLPFEWVHEPRRVNDALLRIDLGVSPEAFPPPAESQRDWVSAATYYGRAPDLGAE